MALKFLSRRRAAKQSDEYTIDNSTIATEQTALPLRKHETKHPNFVEESKPPTVLAPLGLGSSLSTKSSVASSSGSAISKGNKSSYSGSSRSKKCITMKSAYDGLDEIAEVSSESDEESLSRSLASNEKREDSRDEESRSVGSTSIGRRAGHESDDDDQIDDEELVEVLSKKQVKDLQLKSVMKREIRHHRTSFTSAQEESFASFSDEECTEEAFFEDESCLSVGEDETRYDDETTECDDQSAFDYRRNDYNRGRNNRRHYSRGHRNAVDYRRRPIIYHDDESTSCASEVSEFDKPRESINNQNSWLNWFGGSAKGGLSTITDDVTEADTVSAESRVTREDLEDGVGPEDADEETQINEEEEDEIGTSAPSITKSTKSASVYHSQSVSDSKRSNSSVYISKTPSVINQITHSEPVMKDAKSITTFSTSFKNNSPKLGRFMNLTISEKNSNSKIEKSVVDRNVASKSNPIVVTKATAAAATVVEPSKDATAYDCMASSPAVSRRSKDSITYLNATTPTATLTSVNSEIEMDTDVRQRDVFCRNHGGVETLALRQYPSIPTPKESHHVLVRVEASTVSARDCIVRSKGDPLAQPNPPVPGFHIVGEILFLGEKAKSDGVLKIGDRVAALTKGYGNAKYISIPSRDAIVIPPNSTSTEIVCLVSNYMTAYQALNLARKGHAPFTNANVLIMGGSGPVGQALIDLVSREGAKVYTTAHKFHEEHLVSRGAKCFPVKADKWLPLLEGKMDVVIDSVCMDGYESSYRALTPDGILVCTGNSAVDASSDASETFCHSFDAARVQQWWSTMKAKYLWNRAVFYDVHESFERSPTMFKQELLYLICKLERNEISPKVAGRVSLNQVPKAQKLIEKGLPNGTVICLPWKKLDPKQKVPVEKFSR